MNLPATLTNSLWTASSVPAWLRFSHALHQPGVAQRTLLLQQLHKNADTAFGKAHGFAEITGYEEFTRRVPLADYDVFQPWIERIRQGEANVLTRDAVTHLIPTSGSTSARKLIPFTAGLQSEFNAAIGPWLVDLARHHPSVLGGAAYWSVSPVLLPAVPEESAVPIGFDSDAAYLGGARQHLVEAVLAVPAETQQLTTLDSWRYVTLLGLLRRRDLRLISIWHPSFLGLLLDALPGFWDDLLHDVAAGTCRHAGEFPSAARWRGQAAAQPARAVELARLNPLFPARFWPELCVISCWGDAAATLALPDLQRRFPHIPIQPKGLLATEAFVSLPLANQHPLAVMSHFFEFLDDSGSVLLADELRADAEYEPVVTTAGGLCRYRLGDRVRVTGHVRRTPSLRFLGRTSNVSDLFGEKISEAFVVEALREVFSGVDTPPAYCQLAPEPSEGGWRYTLFIECEPRVEWEESLDRALHRNPHYACCRKLGQLLPPNVVKATGQSSTTRLLAKTSPGTPIGAIKPAALSGHCTWKRTPPEC